MKTLIGLLCPFFALTANASEDFVLNMNVSATVCQSVGGIDLCSVMYDQARKNVVVPLSECDSSGPGQETCTGKWEGTRDLGGRGFDLRASVQKSVYPSFDDNGTVTQYLLTASIRTGNGKWHYVHVTTGEKPGLTDLIQIDGEEVRSSDTRVTPGLSVGPAVR